MEKISKHKKEEDYEEYKEKRNEIKTEVKKAKQESWARFGKKMTGNYRENQKLFYGTLKQMRKKKEYNMMNIKDKEGNIITEEDRIMERWKQYFEELTEAQIDRTEEREEREAITDIQEIENIQEKEVIDAIEKLKVGKAPGIDNITPEMIKYMGDEGTKQLTKVMNDIIKKMELPAEWNTGIILPIFKKGDKRNCSNYRGITLSSIPGKILPKVIEKVKKQ